MAAKTATQKQRERRAGKVAAGLVLLGEFWVRPEHRERIRKYIAKLHKENAA